MRENMLGYVLTLCWGNVFQIGNFGTHEREFSAMGWNITAFSTVRKCRNFTTTSHIPSKIF